VTNKLIKSIIYEKLTKFIHIEWVR